MRRVSISIFLVVIVLAMIVIPVCAQENQRSSRVVTQVNENQLVPLRGHLVPWATSKNDVGVAPDSLNVDLMMMLKRTDAQEAVLQKLLAEQQDRRSPNFHKWVSPAEYGTRFGISDADLAKVTAWLKSHGFTVDKVAKGSNLIRFSGTAAQVGAAFHTQLHQYRVGDELHYANVSNPMVPVALAPVITGMYGLNDMQPKPRLRNPSVAKFNTKNKTWQHQKKRETARNATSGAEPMWDWDFEDFDLHAHLMTPGDFATIYNVKPLWDTYDGTGQRIGIPGATDINPKDVDAFRANFGLPEKKLNIIYDGVNPGIWSRQWESEAILDAEWSGAMAPKATVDFVTSRQLVHAIFYIIDNDLDPVMSISYGNCELNLQPAGNAFFTELFKQASSQGITVLLAAGDSGSDTCDQGSYYSVNGLSVDGFGSTPYTVAVGGTDFPVNVIGDASAYWNTTNDSTDLHSAKSYVPEAPWNDSCGSPQVLTFAQNFIPDLAGITTNEALCNNDPNYTFMTVAGGGGGISNCTESSDYDPTTCAGGHPKPAWQEGVPGVSNDPRRHVPDVSFFAGDGLWKSAFVFCQSDNTPKGACDITDDYAVYFNTAGGTSFSSPAFSGIVALLNQKTGGRLGQINYTLYDLAKAQFTDASLKDACKADNITSNACVFQDITQGNLVVPCWAGTADNPPDGKCTPKEDASYQFGLLSGYEAGEGYDPASGLGSVNAYNLVNAWPDGLATAQISLTLTSGSNISYGAKLSGTVIVTGASGSPTGTVSLMYKDSNGDSHVVPGFTGCISKEGVECSPAAAELVNTTATINTSFMPTGTYSLYARYGGDATYAPGASAGQTVTIAPAIATLNFKSNLTSVGEDQSAQLEATINSSSFGDAPTGNVVFKNATTGAVIETVSVTGYKDESTGSAYARAIVSAGVGALIHGSNQITAAYSGDTNYATATGPTLTIDYTGGFAMAASSSSVMLTPGATTGNTVVFTLTPGSGATISPSAITFSCPGTLPDGVSCKFSTPTAGANGTISSTMTLVLNGPLAQNSPAPGENGRWLVPYLAMMTVAGVFVTVPRKRSTMIAMGLVLALVMALSVGCGDDGKKTPPTEDKTITTTLTASSTTPALNAPVTLTARLSKSAAAGTIAFFDGTNRLGNVTASNGAASLTTSSLPVGTRTLTATYGGDSTYPAATSAAVTVDVTFTSTITAQAVDSTTGNVARQNVSLTVK